MKTSLRTMILLLVAALICAPAVWHTRASVATFCIKGEGALLISEDGNYVYCRGNRRAEGRVIVEVIVKPKGNVLSFGRCDDPVSGLIDTEPPVRASLLVRLCEPEPDVLTTVTTGCCGR